MNLKQVYSDIERFRIHLSINFQLLLKFMGQNDPSFDER